MIREGKCKLTQPGRARVLSVVTVLVCACPEVCSRDPGGCDWTVQMKGLTDEDRGQSCGYNTP